MFTEKEKLLKEIGIASFNNVISDSIISFLNDFAQKDRYYNFDSLTIAEHNKDRACEVFSVN